MIVKSLLNERFKNMIKRSIERGENPYDIRLPVNNKWQMRADKQPLKGLIRKDYLVDALSRGGGGGSEKYHHHKQTYLKFTDKGIRHFS